MAKKKDNRKSRQSEDTSPQQLIVLNFNLILNLTPDPHPHDEGIPLSAEEVEKEKSTLGM
jgi:hypothetical protein